MAFEAEQSSEPTVDQMFDSVVEDHNEPVNEPAPAEPKTESEPEFEYSALGATRKEPLSMILKRASMGYDYAQKMEAYKQQQAEVERIRQEAEARHSKFAHLDEYAQQNPEWYNHWSQAYEQRQAGLHQEGTPAIDLSPIKSELDSLKNDFMSVKEFVTKQQQSVEDSKYWDELKAVQKDFPDVDLNLADEHGKTLEYKVLEHAKQNGIGSFRIAFRDFYHDKLRSRMYEQAKQDLLKQDKENRKKGIVGVSNTPMLNSNMPDLRKMSEQQILEMAIAEAESME
jgi:hypothetical protein